MGLKVCMLASTYPRYPGDGSGRFMQSIAEALARQGHEIHVIVPYHPDIRLISGPVKIHPFRYIWPDRWAIMGYAQAMESDQKIHKLAYALAPLFFVSGLRKLMRLTAQYKFDIIHANWIIPNGPIGMLASCIRRIPLIISLHGSGIFVARAKPFLGRIARLSFRQASAVTACSPHLQKGALELDAPLEHTHLLFYGADPDVFDMAKYPDMNELRASLNIPYDATLILSLGRLVKKKGIEYLIQAFPAIQDYHSNTYVIIAGDGPERKPLEHLAELLGVANKTRFTGNISWQQVPEYLRICDIFVVPSVEDEAGNLDGMPNTILEAMAAGKPVIGSRVAGIPLVVRNGKTGLLVEQRQPAQLTKAARKLISTPTYRHKLGQAARDLVENELNWDIVAQTITSLYQTALLR